MRIGYRISKQTKIRKVTRLIIRTGQLKNTFILMDTCGFSFGIHSAFLIY